MVDFLSVSLESFIRARSTEGQGRRIVGNFHLDDTHSAENYYEFTTVLVFDVSNLPRNYPNSL